MTLPFGAVCGTERAYGAQPNLAKLAFANNMWQVTCLSPTRLLCNVQY